ncbi:uncharacterized protein BKA55DRAFT_48810 [Fusarium redolens]|uniref:Uncharacterized protein n=1 Tax=Fusarium redolens TaxID=48865 RepID=A0A9P9KXN0_FUSRE|nr:uncharacterized protein BKA55DRAFT_48810 [Fusarium redolens]KAH7270449.1 hypothetical protein BKA55DRAFT_48810 [Fusarium redolens]
MLTAKQDELHVGPRGPLKAALTPRKQRVELEMRCAVKDVDGARKKPILKDKIKRPAVLNADDSARKMQDELVGLPNVNAAAATQRELLEVRKKRKVISDEVSNPQTNTISGDPIVAKRDRRHQLGLILGLRHGLRNTLTHPLLLTPLMRVMQMVDRPRMRWQDVKLVELIDRNTEKRRQKRPKIGEGDEQGEMIVSAVVGIENVTEIGVRKVVMSDTTAVERQPLWTQQQHLVQVGGRRSLGER